MDPDTLAVDNRFFFERELAWMLQTRKYADEVRNACARPFGSGERTIISFTGIYDQEHLIHHLNAEMRYLHERDVNYRAVSAKLRTAKKTALYDRYEVELDSGRLTFDIVEYVLLSGKRQLIVNPLKDFPSTPTGSLCMDDFPLSRVVLLSVDPVVLAPRSQRH